MLQFLRAFALILLIIVGIIDTRYLHFALSKEWQYIIAVSILVTLIFVDVITAFIFSLLLATIYIKLYDVKIPTLTKKDSVYDDSLLDYITPENLKDAQNNIVNDQVYEKEFKGIEGVYGEPVYGAQGLDDVTPGYSKHAIYDSTE